jgi:hypothetical protein
MTIYRRRLASSFAALTATLANRLERMRGGGGVDGHLLEEDTEMQEAEVAGETVDSEEAAELQRQALVREERSTIESLLQEIRALAPDTKARVLVEALRQLRADGFSQTMVFTQYTDTMDFLRTRLAADPQFKVMCFSGRGGEVRETDGAWRSVSREAAKRHFREGKADVLLCTDAAAEGINFQFCGSLVNYDMPWNPMRVEQRIGRIDRLGQKHPVIRIVNLHYQDTVEADVYLALRERIQLFSSVVGRLQPILSKMPGVISQTVLSGKSSSKEGRSNVVSDLEQAAAAAREAGFDLDEFSASDLEEPAQPEPALTLEDLRRVALNRGLLPPGIAVEPLGHADFSYRAPGMQHSVRITTSTAFFDEHSDSVELWSMGAPCFPVPEVHGSAEQPVRREEFEACLSDQV